MLRGRSSPLLRCLVQANGDIRSKDDLARAAWPGEAPEGITSKAVAEAIRRMKDDLTDNGVSSTWIETIRGHGYRIRQPGKTSFVAVHPECQYTFPLSAHEDNSRKNARRTPFVESLTVLQNRLCKNPATPPPRFGIECIRYSLPRRAIVRVKRDILPWKP